MTTPPPEIGLGFLGMGIVGCGTVETLLANRAEIEARIGRPFVIRRVAVAHPSKPRPVDLDPGIYTADGAAVVRDPHVDIVVEVIGGVEPARTYIASALEHGKQVVSANKELIAKAGAELLQMAAARKLDFAFEGSVAGGIPIILPLKVSLAANSIERVTGIVNGTTNYILTRMLSESAAFEDVLAQAQRLGYAEADPSNDVDGADAAYKLAILASIAFSTRVRMEDVYYEGIRSVTADDVTHARELGYVIKLLAIAKRSGERLELRVHPGLIPADHPLASVNEVFNAVMVKGSSVGEVMFYGQGAGGLPTGSAVASDIIDVARNLCCEATGRLHDSPFHDRAIVPMAEIRSQFYMRLLTLDRPGVIASIATILGDHEVSIASVMQKASHGGVAEIVWVTHPAPEGRFRAALKLISDLPTVHEIGSVLRVEP
ncbi:MAG TPA: homoserine dehydrogenase [Armatimonadota bacterium]|nr:homoserine dehydrogenase [Armatimonadota bacterium]